MFIYLVLLCKCMMQMKLCPTRQSIHTHTRHTPISHAVNSKLLQYVEELIYLLGQYQNEKAKIENSSVVVQIKCAVNPLSAERHLTHQMKYVPSKSTRWQPASRRRAECGQRPLAVCPNCGTLRCLSPRQCERDKYQW